MTSIQHCRLDSTGCMDKCIYFSYNHDPIIKLTVSNKSTEVQTLGAELLL